MFSNFLTLWAISSCDTLDPANCLHQKPVFGYIGKGKWINKTDDAEI